MKKPAPADKKKKDQKVPPSTIPAKITPPSLDDYYLRKTLFQKLDDCRDKPAVWISGPAGSGKTILAASYLRERNISCLWYQIDARDADPATLFYYLGLAAKHYAPGQSKILPPLTPEYLSGMSTFPRNFFETLFELLIPPFALVLDNYQGVAENALLHDMARDMVEEVPTGNQVIFISRSQPPPVLGRFQVYQKMALIGWHELQLSVAEVQAFSGVIQNKPLSRPQAATLHGATLGWVAGVVLMLAQPHTDAKILDADILSAPEVVFDYFAAEILSQLDRTVQKFLVQSAFLPQISVAMATLLTGNKQAGRILADLARKNYFTMQRSRPAKLYQYHPLFKAFLQQQARQMLSVEQLKALQQRTARLLIDADQYDEAADLLQSTQSWDLLAELICAQAKTLVAQGRLGTLQGWIESLPASMFDQQPWLHYWRGVCRLIFAPDQSQQDFERAFAGFSFQKDVAGLYLSWSGVVKSIVYLSIDLRPLAQWIEELQCIREQYPKFPSQEIEARFLISVLSNLILPMVKSEDFGAWVQQAEDLYGRLSDINLRLEMGIFLMEYHSFTGSYMRYASIGNELTQLADSDAVRPFMSLAIYMTNIFGCWHWGDNHKAIEYLEKAISMADASGIHLLDGYIWGAGACAALCLEDLERADQYLRNMEQSVALQPQNFNKGHFHAVSGWRELVQGRIIQAVAHFKAAGQIFHQVGAVLPNFHCYQGLALALLAQDKKEDAYGVLEKATAISTRLEMPWIDYHNLLVRAYLDLVSGRRETGLDCLARALALASQHNFSQTYIWQFGVMAFLYLHALENGIEADYVLAMIRKFNISAPTAPMKSAHWPWPVRIFTLGRFEVLADDQALTPKAFSQGKPMALLKAIIAHGGHHVSEARLLDDLWPEADGDAAHVAFTTTLHRLRKMLGVNQAITLNGHRVSLDPQYCWVDLFSLKSILSAADEHAGTSGTDGDRQLQMVDQILRLYQGHFLAGEDEVWLLNPREKLHTQVLQRINRAAAACETRKQWAIAADLYEAGLKIDSLVESFYQGVMRCNIQLGRRAEALVVYRRCRKALHDLLSISPSQETQALADQIEG